MVSNQLHDSHCHLDFDIFDSDRREVLTRAREAGLAFILNPGIDLETSQKALNLASANSGFVFAAIGYHPNYGNAFDSASLEALRALASNPTVLAIGEIGLDYYRHYTEPALQRRIFCEQLSLAAELELPVVLHNRDASNDLIPILTDWFRALPDQSRLKHRPGDLHSYSGDLETALLLTEMGFVFGINGPVTFKNAREKQAVVAGLPLQNIILETDAPFLTPHPHRGKRNEPAFIPHIVAEIARLHQTTPAEVARITTATARELFGLNQTVNPES